MRRQGDVVTPCTERAPEGEERMQVAVRTVCREEDTRQEPDKFIGFRLQATGSGPDYGLRTTTDYELKERPIRFPV
jgi:hypothetical protein